jgi:phage/plasmid-associated DNA primase
MVADFRHRFEGEAEDKTLYSAMTEEREGILAILARAASWWYEIWASDGGGLTLPPRVVDQSREFVERHDPIADCLREVFTLHPDQQTTAHKAYETYLQWHARSGRPDEAVSMVRFSLALEKKGFRKIKGRSANIYIGLRSTADIIAEAREAEDDDD